MTGIGNYISMAPQGAAFTLVRSRSAAPIAVSGRAAGATDSPPGHSATPPGATAALPDSLRALASKVGLRIGTAVNTDALAANAQYRQITADQFSPSTSPYSRFCRSPAVLRTAARIHSWLPSGLRHPSADGSSEES